MIFRFDLIAIIDTIPISAEPNKAYNSKPGIDLSLNSISNCCLLLVNSSSTCFLKFSTSVLVDLNRFLSIISLSTIPKKIPITAATEIVIKSMIKHLL